MVHFASEYFITSNKNWCTLAWNDWCTMPRNGWCSMGRNIHFGIVSTDIYSLKSDYDKIIAALDENDFII